MVQFMLNNCREYKIEFREENQAKSKFLTPIQRQFLINKLRTNLQPGYRRRIEIMLLADIGKTQTEICKILGCSREMARYWVGILQKGMVYKWDKLPIGRPKSISNEYIEHLRELASYSPHKYGYAFSSWTTQCLSKHLAQEFGIQISRRHIHRLLKQMGISIK
jgi:transposase